MTNKCELSIPSKNTYVTIDEGELISYKVNDQQLIHQKNEPGWGSADTEMFPVIGPTVQNQYIVKTPKGQALQEQHGLLRAMKYFLKSDSHDHAVFEKKYIANTKIVNPKFPSKSTLEEMFWPYDFEFTKSFTLLERGLLIKFQIRSKEEMPYMFGYHPAFRLSKKKATIKNGKQKIDLADVIERGNDAFPIYDTNEVRLMTGDIYDVVIKTSGFDNMMLWSPTEEMICIEPVTQYQSQDNQDRMKTCPGVLYFMCEINPILNL